MKPKHTTVEESKRPLRLSTQDKSFISLAAAILEQPEETIIKSLVRKRQDKLQGEAA